MKTSVCVTLSVVVALLLGAATPALAQTATAPSPGSASPASDTPSPQDTSSAQKPTQPPQKDWPRPVEDQHRYLFVLADLLEYRPKGRDSDFRWDIEGWYGGDYNRVWIKSEGEQSDRRTEYNTDFQLLYGRFVRRYYDFQIGGRVETRTFLGRNVTRGHGVVGFEGFAPYRFDVESALFISQNGDVSGRFTFTRDFLLTQRLILQPRFEANAAIQKVEKFSVGRGLNNIELGLRLRYEIRREFAPYIGVSFERSLFGTAGLVRREGGDPSRVGFVTGVRLWF
jgi:copper resistance protein B